MFKAWKTILGDDGLDIAFEDFKLVPQAMLDVFDDRVRRYEKRLLRLNDQFAVAIYTTHIQGSITAMLKVDSKSVKMFIDHAEPEAIKEKAWIYAKIITEPEYSVILEIIEDMENIIKEAKETKGGIN